MHTSVIQTKLKYFQSKIQTVLTVYNNCTLPSGKVSTDMPISDSACICRGSFRGRNLAGGLAAFEPSICLIGWRTFSATRDAVFGHVLKFQL